MTNYDVSTLQYWILHNYSHHNEEANELKPTVKPRCIKLTTIMSGPRSLGHHGPKSLDGKGNLPQLIKL